VDCDAFGLTANVSGIKVPGDPLTAVVKTQLAVSDFLAAVFDMDCVVLSFFRLFCFGLCAHHVERLKVGIFQYHKIVGLNILCSIGLGSSKAKLSLQYSING
jgi:hypothetical protein